MIERQNLIVLADKSGLEMERTFDRIPFRHATGGEEDSLEPLITAAEIELGHLMDWNVVWSRYLREMSHDLAQYITQLGSCEAILYERLDANPEKFQACSTMGFPCRIELIKEEDRGIVSLETTVANFRPGQLPPDLTE